MNRKDYSEEVLDSQRFPLDPWRLTDRLLDPPNFVRDRSLFAVSNGYIGLRGGPGEHESPDLYGTLINGFHETWPIQHAEAAFGYAQTGQTVIAAPDATAIELYLDDEPLSITSSDVGGYERSLDFRAGHSTTSLVWRTASSRKLRLRWTRLASAVQRHLALIIYELELVEGPAANIRMASHLVNRQDLTPNEAEMPMTVGEGTYTSPLLTLGRRILEPTDQKHLQPESDGGTVLLGYRAARSGMTIAAGQRHELSGSADTRYETSISPDSATTSFLFTLGRSAPVSLTKFVTYHTSRGIPTAELFDRAERTLRRAAHARATPLIESQRNYFENHWHQTGVEFSSAPATEQAARWSLFQMAQNTACSHESGVPARGVTGAGYEGHYFWDTEMHIVPALAYTNPPAARSLLRFRYRMLDAARARAKQLNARGALYPWRTINGEEASAYYAAGTAQYHINAAIAYAIHVYTKATGDRTFLEREGSEILVETARLWADLGHWITDDEPRYEIHGVTGPDEYTTVVNNNLYTNVMAKFNLSYASRTMREFRDQSPDIFRAVARKTELRDDEIDLWEDAAASMYKPFDSATGIYPQDDFYLALAEWSFDEPDNGAPLLQKYHPLVIYRHQVSKMADVVLAMHLVPGEFEDKYRARNFRFYQERTTGDSSLSAAIEAIVAVDTDHQSEALGHINHALYLDLSDLHHSTISGIHIANSGGTWLALAHGFAGLRDSGEVISLKPNIPPSWGCLAMTFTVRGSLVRLEASGRQYKLSVVSGNPLTVRTSTGKLEHIEPGQTLDPSSATAPTVSS